ncbi:oxygenase MpaB family protein [Melittangium boletus]|uniref:ER-bound oxygenase mpaB/mpaB'/Rubber oxygenase catalytic domain-containing protein n=1 Tax=Melittangium boletus DSM 14713 TaxID=1294270 RepID=A0A250IIT5_9BACT|nr:oxygenase MpaB family protein [Melittangium boletus]ATB31081.1 hypothetical protein MEBOL_004543 [Melittangium boletus DSM 14713]
MIPNRLVNFEATRARHGDKADFMARMLAVGDPLADAVIVELDELGKEGRRVLNAGLEKGLDSLESPPPAIAALLRQLETVPGWVDREALLRGDEASLSIPPLWSNLAFSVGALVHTYSSPAIARLLVQSGRLTTMASRRLLETGIWRIHGVLPGGLVRGAPGYIQTVQVRLLHARVRATTLKHGWEREQWGVPISQVDVARTWLDFNVVPLRALETMGITLTPARQQALYRHWWYVGHLLGLDEGFFLPVRDHADAGELLDLVDSTIQPPDENSRALVSALIDSTTDMLCAPKDTPFTRPLARDLLNALTRRFQGDARADELGIPATPTTSLLPLIAASNAELRRWQFHTPESTARVLEENGAGYLALATVPPDGTEYQKHVGTGD